MFQRSFLDQNWVSEAADTLPALTSPEAAFKLLDNTQLWPVDRECAWMLVLNTKHRLMRWRLVSVGSVDHTFMAPREIFRQLLLDNAAAFVMAHNHPSGDPEPSRDDMSVTRRLHRAGEVMGVELLDHLVVAPRESGGYRWASMARRGVL